MNIAKYSKSIAAFVTSAVMFAVAHAFISEGDGRTLIDAIGVAVNLAGVYFAPKNTPA